MWSVTGVLHWVQLILYRIVVPTELLPTKYPLMTQSKTQISQVEYDRCNICYMYIVRSQGREKFYKQLPNPNVKTCECRGLDMWIYKFEFICRMRASYNIPHSTFYTVEKTNE